jgi:hypothetical protein
MVLTGGGVVEDAPPDTIIPPQLLSGFSPVASTGIDVPYEKSRNPAMSSGVEAIAWTAMADNKMSDSTRPTTIDLE